MASAFTLDVCAQAVALGLLSSQMSVSKFQFRFALFFVFVRAVRLVSLHSRFYLH